MFNHDPFYHKSIRRMCIVFTTLFNDISIDRETSGGVVDSTIKVPITFSSKSKWYRKLREEISSKPKDISRLLPRLGADLMGLRYDSSRTGVVTTKHSYDYPILDASSSSSSDSFYYKQRKKSFRRMPYTFDFELSIASKTMTDGLMILEQILPFFKPDVSVTINDINALDINTDVSVVLKDIAKETTRFDGFDSLDLITWTLSFELKGFIYGPIADTNVIIDTSINMYDDMPEESPSRVVEIQSETIDGIAYDIDDPDTYNTTITEYLFGSSSSSSG